MLTKFTLGVIIIYMKKSKVKILLEGKWIEKPYAMISTIARTHGCVRNGSETHSTGVTGLHSRRTPIHSRFYHTHIMYKGNWDDFCLVNSIYFALYIFLIRILLDCVDESWWNMPFKVTRPSDDVADDAVAMLLPLWLHAAAWWRHAVWLRIVTSHNARMGYGYSCVCDR